MPITKQDIHFVLVRTRFASNLGSSARAIKNMGFNKLILVEPECEVGVEARAYAMKGAPILDQAVFLPSLSAALSHLSLLVATTGRFREPRPSLLDCRPFALRMAREFSPSAVGIVFGSEENGLSREELSLCHWMVRIPTDSDYPVMNLAQAVAVVAYEMNSAFLGRSENPEDADRQANRMLHEATAIETQAFLEFVERFLLRLDLPEDVRIDRIMRRIRRIAARSRLEKEDINLLRGLLLRFRHQRQA
jgi:TrmH family RNA methyltransferase